MPNRILLIFITLLLGIGSASAQKYPERSLVRKATGISRRSGTTAASNATRRRSKRPPKTSRPPTTWGAPSTVPKNTRRRPRCSNASPQTPPAPTRNGRGFLQPRQRPIQTGKIPGSARKLQELPADESCRPGAKYNYAYTKRLLQKQQNEDQNKDQNKDQQNSGGQGSRNQRTKTKE